MSNPTAQKVELGSSAPVGSSPRGRTGNRKILKVAAVVVAVGAVSTIALGWLASPGGSRQDETIPVVPVTRGGLTVTVTQGGTLRAMESLEIKSEVEGNNQILQIVPEGTIVSDDDVANTTVLVRLDTSGMEDRRASNELSCSAAEASLVQAQQTLEIQKKQSESDVTLAELNVRFARMDFERYVGADLAHDSVEGGISLNFSALGQNEKLGGLALQNVRSMRADVDLAEMELTQATEKLSWTERLKEKEYASLNDLKADQLSVERCKAKKASDEQALDLYLRYTLPKEAEKAHSDYVESTRQLDRVKAKAESELAQCQANLKSKEASYNLEKERLEKTVRMLDKSTIKATKPGLVVYASTAEGPFHGSSTPIQEGTSVRQNQTIITVPNLTTLAARVNVHETDIEKVKVGQTASVKLDAVRGSSIAAQVAKISPMASSQDRWLNPDVVVYQVDVALEEVPEGLKPGMSATAEIIVAELQDVLQVPLQAVTTYKGQRICWVQGPEGPQMRQIEAGYYTDKYVEVKDGLREGELVYLAPPEELPEERAQAAPAGQQPAAEGQQQPAGQQAAPTPPQQAPGPAAAQPGQAGPQEQPAAPAQQPDLNAMRKQLEGLTPEQRRQKMRELMDQLPADQRDSIMRQLRGGSGRGAGTRAPRPEGQPAEQPDANR